jgi:hypothetical protein
MLLYDGKSFSPPTTAQSGVDAGSPRLGNSFSLQGLLFELMLRQAQKDYEVDIKITYK